TGKISDTGTIAFNDVDLIDVHTASATPAAGNTLGGTLTMGTASESATTEPGSVSWTYEVNNSATQYLAVGESTTEQFTVTVSDGHGGTATQAVTVTIHGTNDDPTITVAGTDASGDVTEDLAVVTGKISDTGTIAFNDVDLIDVHTASATPAAGNTLGGTLTMGTASESATTEPGSVSWTYEVNNSATQYLAVGESTTEQFTVTVSDGHGGTATQAVTVTIHGTNDDPTITVGANDSAAETLVETNAGLSISDTLTVTDIDLSDSVTAAVVGVVASG